MNPNKVTSSRVKIFLLKTMKDMNPENLNMSDLISREIGMSYIHIGAIFKKAEGISIHKWMSRERIEVSKQMIREGKQNLESISINLGFSTNAHFSMSFKRVTGITPTEYRNQLNDNL